MDNWIVFLRGDDHQENDETPPPRVCPRCNSDNTKFCYYNNYSLSQPRYFCKDCRPFWTHGGALRNIPIGGSVRKAKHPKIDQPPASQVVAAESQQVHHHQPFLHVEETNEFLGSFGGGSSSVAVGNHFGSFPEIHGDMLPPFRSIPPIMDRSDFSHGSFHQGYDDGGSNDSVFNPLINNQSIGSQVNNYRSYPVSQEDQNKWKQSNNNSMNMNHNASTSGIRGYPGTDHMTNNNNNKCMFHEEKPGP